MQARKGERARTARRPFFSSLVWLVGESRPAGSKGNESRKPDCRTTAMGWVKYALRKQVTLDVGRT